MSLGDSGAPELEWADRLLGFDMFRLVGTWPEWVHRRVETVTWESGSSIRRQISVDLRLREDYFGRPRFRWDDRYIYYVPIAQLKKRRFLGFDLRDESGCSLPMMTRRKNSIVAAAMLSAVAQTLIAQRMEKDPSFKDQEINAIDFQLPRELEVWFWRMSHPLRGWEQTYDEFIEVSTGTHPEPEEWQWKRDADGGWVSGASDGGWRQFLLEDPGFRQMARDVAERFLLCVPLRWQPGHRRIVKFAYTDYFALRPLASSNALKDLSARWPKAVGAWNALENWMEGFPRVDALEPEWMPGGDDTSEPAPRSPLQALRQSLGLAAKQFVIVATNPGLAGSYHMTVNAPPGIQIRQAQLTLKNAGTEPEALRPIRAFKGVRTVDLYTDQAKPEQNAEADVRVKPHSSMMVRGGFVGAMLAWVTLGLTMVVAPNLKTSHGIDGAVALLVVLPGLVGAFASREAGHPLATSMLVALRVATLIPAIGSFLMAGLLLIDDARSPGAYADLVCVGLDMVFLAVVWRLADRGLPHSNLRPSAHYS